MPDDIPADHHRGAADGQQRHREAAVERGDGRVEEMGAGLVAVGGPVPGAGGENRHEE